MVKVWRYVERMQLDRTERTHLFNLVGGPFLLALFLWSFQTRWIVVPVALFVGAAIHNSVIGLLVRRDLRRNGVHLD